MKGKGRKEIKTVGRKRKIKLNKAKKKRKKKKKKKHLPGFEQETLG